MTSGSKILINLSAIVLSFATAFFAIWVHQYAYNTFIPPTFGLPEITYFQAFVLGFVGAVFYSSSTVGLLENIVKKDLSEDEKTVYPLIKVLHVLVGLVVELGIVWLISKIAL